MKRKMIQPFLVRSMLVFASLEAEKHKDLLRRGVAALGQYEGQPFTGADTLSKQFLAGGPPGPAMDVWLVHPSISAQSDAGSDWLKLTVADDGHGKPTYLFTAINIGRAAEQVESQWRLGLWLMERLVRELRPVLGFMNGDLVESETYRPLPRPKDFTRTSLPLAFTPWTYVSQERVRDPAVKKRLLSLPAAEITSTQDGWIIHAVRALDDPVDPQFIESLRALDQDPIRYIPPHLERS